MVFDNKEDKLGLWYPGGPSAAGIRCVMRGVKPDEFMESVSYKYNEQLKGNC
jgi:hypothetical protein